jgi:site-specific DNA recombinase
VGDVLPRLDTWLSKQFAPHRLEETIDELAAAGHVSGHDEALAEVHAAIRDCDTRMTRYRAAV